MDEVVEREVTLEPVPMDATSSPEQRLEIFLESIGCALPEGAAITGSLRNADGSEVEDASVEVELFEGHPCTVQDSLFSCPILSAYPATYTLRAEIGPTRLQKTVTASATDCLVTPTITNIDLSERDCGSYIRQHFG